MPLNLTPLPTNRGDGDAGHTSGHNSTNSAVNAIASAVDALALAAAANLPLYNVEAYGATGNGTTDDYAAIKAAWDALIASGGSGLLFFPRAVSYRCVATTGRLSTTGSARALFPIPMVSAEGPLKRTLGVLGVGSPYVVRSATTFGLEATAKQVATASVLKVDYDPDVPFTWSGSLGLPSVFGAPDADVTGHTDDNIVTNIHWVADRIIVRQPGSPSLAGMNVEMCSTMHLGQIRFDVLPVLDRVPEPVYPTGVALVAPKSNNNVVVRIDLFVAEGHYAGLPYTEHVDVGSAVLLRNKIGIHNRRACSHFGKIGMVKLEQCKYGLAGWTPAGTGPNLGVIPWVGGTVVIDFVDVEDFDYLGLDDSALWFYTPVSGAHVYASNGGLSGRIGAYKRVNSASATPPSIGIAPFGVGDDIYVLGNTDSGLGISGFAIYNFTGTGIAIDSGLRHLGTAPTNVLSPPDVPTIGTATGGVQSATVAFTPAGTGETATLFRAISTPGSLAGTGTTSPITVSGLTAGVNYTFTVRAQNSAGNSAESSSSNSVTPSAPPSLPSDNFNRSNATSLGTSSSGGTWLGDPNSSWGITSNAAKVRNANDTADPVWIECGQTSMTVQADITMPEGEGGLIGRVTDVDNYAYLDLTRADSTHVNMRLYKRVGGTFTAQGSGATQVAWNTGATHTVKLVCAGTTFTMFMDGTQLDQVTITGLSGTKAGFVRLASQGGLMIIDAFGVT